MCSGFVHQKPTEMSHHVEDHIWHHSIWSILNSVSMMGNYFCLFLMCCHVTWRYTQLEIRHRLNSNNPIKWGWDKIVQLNIQYVNNLQIHNFCGLWVSVMLQVAKGILCIWVLATLHKHWCTLEQWDRDEFSSCPQGQKSLLKKLTYGKT